MILDRQTVIFGAILLGKLAVFDDVDLQVLSPNLQDYLCDAFFEVYITIDYESSVSSQSLLLVFYSC
jgi:hypothetical protein